MSTVQSEPFGAAHGEPVTRFTLSNEAGMQVRIISYGAIIQSLIIPDRDGIPADVVLGFDTLEAYVTGNDGYFGAICGRVANRITAGRFTLEGIDYELVLVDDGSSDETVARIVPDGRTRIVEFEKNTGQSAAMYAGLHAGKGRLLALIDGDLVLYESMAINHYLADRYDGGLSAATPEGVARALMWSFWATNEIENLLRPLLRNRLFLEEPDRDSVQGDRAAAQLEKPLRILDEALAGNDFLLGGDLCVADINVSHHKKGRQYDQKDCKAA